MKYFSVGIGLTAGNFFFQALKSVPDWGTALERSWFQIIAIIAIVVTARLWSQGEEK